MRHRRLRVHPPAAHGRHHRSSTTTAGQQTPTDFNVHVRSGADVAGSPAPGTAGGTDIHAEPGRLHRRRRRRLALHGRRIGGACAATGAVSLGESEAKTCAITESDKPPVVGKLVNAEPARGTVKIKLPKGKHFRRAQRRRAAPRRDDRRHAERPDHAARGGRPQRRTRRGRVLRRHLQARPDEEQEADDGPYPHGEADRLQGERQGDRRRPRKRRSGGCGATARAGSRPRASTAQRRSSGPSGWSRIGARPRSRASRAAR